MSKVMLNSLLITGMSIFAACLYGVLHDLVTTRVCLEYFTIGHADVFHTTDPTMLALGWGIYATWYVGLIIGIPLALTAQVGPWPRHSPRSLFRPIAILLLMMGLCALLAGICGWIAASNGLAKLPHDAGGGNDETAFLAVWWAHMTSYASGFVGGLFLIAYVADQRRKLSRDNESL